jgi:hypothetical protein
VRATPPPPRRTPSLRCKAGLIHPTRPVFLCELAPSEHPPARADAGGAPGRAGAASPDLATVGEGIAMEALALEAPPDVASSHREVSGLRRAASETDVAELAAPAEEEVDERGDALEQLGGGEDTLVGSVPGALGLQWHVPPAPFAHAPSERTASHEQRSSAIASSGADKASSQDRRSAADAHADGAGAWHAASSRRSRSWHEEVRVVFRNMDEAADGGPSLPLRDLLGRTEFPKSLGESPRENSLRA